MAEYILASQSPRRKQLLQWAEIDFEIMVADTDETFPEGLAPHEASIYIAQQKAVAIKEIVGAEGPLLPRILL
jgi:septum formation protein